MSEAVEAPVVTARRDHETVRTAVKYALIVAAGIVVWLLPAYVKNEWLVVLMWIMTGAVGAMGLTMLVGQAGQLSLAHTFFLLVGGVAYAVFASKGTSEYIGFGLPTLLSAVLAVLVSAAAGALFAPISGRLRGIYLGVASLSLVFLGFWLANQLPSLAGSASSGRYAPSLNFFGFDFGVQTPSLYVLNVPMGQTERTFWLFAALTAIAYALGRGAMNGRVGRGWRAVRDNEAMAAVMGVSVVRQKAMAFAISSAYAGLAGVMTVWWYSGLMKPDEAVDHGTYSTTVAISFLAMCVIGGLGSLGGSVIGAALVFGLPLALPLIRSEDTVSAGGTAFTPVVITNLIYGALIVLIVIFQPRGLAGLWDRAIRLVRR
ncbi:branched-chain amino acid ABC transporter permease [Flexivirga meconopsidis]|uniref:branched-chain amino acid ABC transporter permease n=1 Tax=Flexivirga meconopsidis TaxID=2977121 RepID=UPI00223FB829